MEIGIKERVLAWAKSGGDFMAGLSLFLTWNRNTYYVRNIELKGKDKGLETLIAEFAYKLKIPAAALREMIMIPVPAENIDHKANQVVNFEIEATKQERTANELVVKKKTKLRDEFPFLGSRDCPEEFAILVNKMLTAHDDYIRNRENLFDVDKNNPDQCYQVAREVLDAYLLNRDIWEEMNYYKLHGKILGKLPEFRLRGLRDEYGAMTTARLVQISTNNIRRNLSYNKKKLSDSKTKNKEEIRQRMQEEEDKLNIINKILLSRGEMS